MIDPFREIDAVTLAGETFTLADAEAIIATVNAVGGGEPADADEFAPKLMAELNVVAGLFAAEDYEQDLPRPNQLADQLNRIVAAADKLLAEMEADKDGVAHHLGPRVLWKSAAIRRLGNGQEAILNAVRGVITLRNCAQFAANLEENAMRENPPSRGKRRDIAMAKLVSRLAESFRWAWDQTPTRSTDRITEEAGKFPTFLRLVLDRLAPHRFSPVAIDGLIRRHGPKV